jgi:hypothetical protein
MSERPTTERGAARKFLDVPNTYDLAQRLLIGPAGRRSPTGEQPMSTQRKNLMLAAAAATATVCAAALAHSQSVGPTWDTSQLPETKGSVKQYTLTPRGDVDGLILSDGTEVKLPPHLTGPVVFAIKPGDSVTVRGLKSRALPLVQAAAVTNDASGATIVDDGPPAGPARAAADQTIYGDIAATLHGARGEVNGALLVNGIILRLPLPEAERVQEWLQPGRNVSVRGAVLRSPLGAVVDVTAIGASSGAMTEVSPAPPPRRPS